MNSQERVRTAIQHQTPDRMPFDLVATNEVWNKLVAHFDPDIMAWKI
jgi:hypothetical protein